MIKNSVPFFEIAVDFACRQLLLVFLDFLSNRKRYKLSISLNLLLLYKLYLYSGLYLVIYNEILVSILFIIAIYNENMM